MRKILLLVLLAACGEPALKAQTLPTLIANPRHTPIVVNRLVMPDGERIRWEVHHKGFTIGRAEMVVGGAKITSRFRTSQLASMFAKAEHELTTSIAHEGTYPDYASETANVNGTPEKYEVMFDHSVYVIDGKPRRVPDGVAHTMHSAPAVLRAWASTTAKPGYLRVLHAGELYKLDVDTPVREDWRGTATLKIEGRILGFDKPILVTLFLTDDDRRLPIRFVISNDGKQIDADKIAD